MESVSGLGGHDHPRGSQPRSVSLEHRQQMLMMAVSAETIQGGRVISWGQTSAEVVRVPKSNDLVHAALSIITAGLWLIPWLIISSRRKIHRFQVTVDELGVVRYLPPVGYSGTPGA